MSEIINVAGTHETEFNTAAFGPLRYTIQLPPGFPDQGPYPFVLALHYGFDRTAPFPPYYGRGVLDGLVGPALNELGAIIVAPDSHGENWDDGPLGTGLLELTDWVFEHYPVDRQRTLLTGFSLGGMGTWHLMSRAEKRFRAAISVAAVPKEPALADFPDAPLYLIHSDLDEIFPMAKFDAAIDALNARGITPHVEKITGVTHFNVPGFGGALRGAVPWLEQVWADPE